MARMTKEEQERLKKYARHLYIDKGITTAKALALEVGITEKTASKWIAEGNWEKYKKNIVLTREEQMNLMLDELEQINNHIKEQPDGQQFADYKLAMVRRQLIKDIKDLETKALVSEHINSLTQFLSYVRVQNVTDGLLIARYVDMFIKSELR